MPPDPRMSDTPYPERTKKKTISIYGGLQQPPQSKPQVALGELININILFSKLYGLNM